MNCVCDPRFFATIKPFTDILPVKTDYVEFSHLYKCEQPVGAQSFFDWDVVPVDNLMTVLFKIVNEGITFLAVPLNEFELE